VLIDVHRRLIMSPPPKGRTISNDHGLTMTVCRIVAGRGPHYSLSMREKVCKTCLVEHDEEIHAATLSIHEWLRSRVRPIVVQPPVEESVVSAVA